jgi:hypothetical protein
MAWIAAGVTAGITSTGGIAAVVVSRVRDKKSKDQ